MGISTPVRHLFGGDADPAPPRRPPAVRDGIAVVTFALLGYLIGGAFDVAERAQAFLGRYEWMQADELVVVAVAAIAVTAWWMHRRWREGLEALQQHRAAEAALRNRAERFALAIRGSNDGIWDWDLRTRELYFSPRWKAMLGLPEDATGELWRPRVHPDDIETLAAAAAPLLSGTSDWFEWEHRLRHVDGTYRWMLARGVAERDATGTAYRLAGSQTDVTERKQDQLTRQALQASLQLATESAKVAVWQCDLRTLTIRFSSGWKTVLGRDAGEIALSALWDLVHPDDRAAITAIMQDGLQGGAGGYETEERMRHADGTYRWVLSRGRLAPDEEGHLTRLYGADIDITERKALEEALRRSEDQYRHLVEEIAEVIYATDREGRVTYISPVAERLFGYAYTDVLDRPFSTLVFPADRPAVADAFRQALSGQPRPREHRVITKTGAIGWVRNHVRTVVEGDRIVGLRGVLSDITAQQEAEAVLRERTAQLEIANDELEAFSYSVSHDLLAPLRHVEAFSEQLRHECAAQLNESGRHALARITTACARMRQLIEDLLALSRVGRYELRRESVDLSAVAHEIIAALRERQPEREVTVTIAAGLRATGDPGLLRVVLENLLGNAWKYTSKRPHACIEFGSVADTCEPDEAEPILPAVGGRGRGVTFFVRDNGAGFDPAYAERLFVPFQRLHGAAEFEGTGIGLAIVQRIIRRHGGRVGATAALDQGATFSFALPDPGERIARVRGDADRARRAAEQAR